MEKYKESFRYYSIDYK